MCEMNNADILREAFKILWYMTERGAFHELCNLIFQTRHRMIKDCLIVALSSTNDKSAIPILEKALSFTQPRGFDKDIQQVIDYLVRVNEKTDLS